MDAQGWYADPFAEHEARWFSAGAPTQLVRDGDVESTDPPPADTWTGPMTPAPEADTADGADLRRAGDGPAARRPDAAAAVDAFHAFGGFFS